MMPLTCAVLLAVHVRGIGDSAIDDGHANAGAIQALRPGCRSVDGGDVVVVDRHWGGRASARAPERSIGRDINHVGIVRQIGNRRGRHGVGCAVEPAKFPLERASSAQHLLMVRGARRTVVLHDHADLAGCTRPRQVGRELALARIRQDAAQQGRAHNQKRPSPHRALAFFPFHQCLSLRLPYSPGSSPSISARKTGSRGASSNHGAFLCRRLGWRPVPGPWDRCLLNVQAQRTG